MRPFLGGHAGKAWPPKGVFIDLASFAFFLGVVAVWIFFLQIVVHFLKLQKNITKIVLILLPTTQPYNLCSKGTRGLKIVIHAYCPPHVGATTTVLF